MIRIYQGVDLVDVSRFRDVLERHDQFMAEVFTDSEKTYCLSRRNSHIHFAGRFAAKEAGMKALGLGLSGGKHTLREIETISGPSGKPEIRFSGWTEKLSMRRKISQQTLSISHTATHALATVILLGGENT